MVTTHEAQPAALSGSSRRRPLQPTGVLDGVDHIDLTPVIGREFPTAKLVDWINATNADELLRELAYTISSRGVVFFRAQDQLTNDLQKQLMQRLGELSGKPADSGLHIHPVLNTSSDVSQDRDPDQEISTISSSFIRQLGSWRGHEAGLSDKKQTSTGQWHSDIGYEVVPADYTSLRLVQLPKTGGDTVWASGYEIYDRISSAYQQFLESLTATFSRPDFLAAVTSHGYKLFTQPRGSPLNVGGSLTAVHPVVRTNPVTGWKSVYPVGQNVRFINGLTAEESEGLLQWFKALLLHNHDLQVRFRWQNVNDMAIWDNRCTFHTATYDFDGLGERSGNRAVGIGEKPYLDPTSKSRREALAGEEIGNPFKDGQDPGGLGAKVGV
ncbi:Alpha-ketoglutarate-dependent dioxygenase [Fulvia fulva]|nr:Alpha-ketoglutarate-dependent dioxygenase [Fulvia fulva]WPV17934.1 Alpha-ketoglutarate-dependent dioxygenase [Fulvia fulva]WPV32749.1 Alpha-ketoglutarate-dependent dioxygenase [Fulvia fulva]